MLSHTCCCCVPSGWHTITFRTPKGALGDVKCGRGLTFRSCCAGCAALPSSSPTPKKETQTGDKVFPSCELSRAGCGTLPSPAQVVVRQDLQHVHDTVLELISCLLMIDGQALRGPQLMENIWLLAKYTLMGRASPSGRPQASRVYLH